MAAYRANGAQLGWLLIPEQRAVQIWRAANGPGAAPMGIGVRMELELPELERAGTRLELEDPLVRIAVDPSPRHMQGIRLIRQPERSSTQH
jgi:hypothetical protein